MANVVKDFNLIGKTIVPIGYARWYVDQGALIYDASKVDGSLTSLHVVDYMLRPQYDYRDVLVLEKGKVESFKMPTEGIIRLILPSDGNVKLVGLLGQSVPHEQLLATVAKLTYKCGFSRVGDSYNS